jgi:hypothetical protein
LFESYTVVMDNMRELGKTLEKVSSVRDGMELEDKLSLPDYFDGFVPAVATGPSISEDSCSGGSVTFSGPEKKWRGGANGRRPTTSTDKPRDASEEVKILFNMQAARTQEHLSLEM